MKTASGAAPNNRLRRARERRCWAQEDVANQVGTNPFTVSRWERGLTFPGPRFRQRLCEVFGASADELGLLPPERKSDDGDRGYAHMPDTPIYLNRCAAPMYAAAAFPFPPAATCSLIGRDEAMRRLVEQLLPGGSPALTAISGLPGVGKTALAIALTNHDQIQEHYADGVFWAGLGPEPYVPGLLSRWGAALNVAVAKSASRTTIEELGAAIRDAIGTRRMLLTIDDAWTIEDALAFMVGGPRCAYLLTTRFTEIALRFAGTGAMVVHELGEDDGMAVMAQLAPDVASGEPEAVRSLVRAVGALPLALTLMGRYVQIQSFGGQPRRARAALDHLYNAETRLHLAEPRAPLDRPTNLSSGTLLSLQASIGASYNVLPPPARILLCALALFPAKPNSFSEEAALVVAASEPSMLDALVDAGMIESNSRGRYMLHQAIADFARLKGSSHHIIERLVAYCTEFVAAHQADFDVLDYEASNILAALQAAFNNRLAAPLLHGATALFSYLLARGQYATAEHVLTLAHDAAEALGDHDGQVDAALQLGISAKERGDYDRAEIYGQEAVALAHRTGDAARISTALRLLGMVAVKRGAYDQAEAHGQQALAAARQAGEAAPMSAALHLLGVVAKKRGEYAQGIVYLREGLVLARQMGDIDRMSSCLLNLGTLMLNQGDDAEAEELYSEGLVAARSLGHRERLCSFLLTLGVLANKRGKNARAESCFREALAVSQSIGHRELVIGCLDGLGVLATQSGDFEQARAYGEAGLALAHEIGHREHVCAMLLNLGKVSCGQGDDALSDAYLHEARNLARDLGHREHLGTALVDLARLACDRGDYDEARRLLSEAQSIAATLSHRALIAAAADVQDAIPRT